MPNLIFEIIELALGVAKNAALGTPAEAGVSSAAALEQIVAKAIAAYNAEAGKPMDLSKLTPEDPIV